VKSLKFGGDDDAAELGGHVGGGRLGLRGVPGRVEAAGLGVGGVVPAAPPEASPAGYASALERLHAGMRRLDIPAPHFTERTEQAQQLVASRNRTPALAVAARELLGGTLRSLRRAIGDCGAAEQLLHGEPHPGNVLTTKNGLLFTDFETCCRGPVLAMITTWRWDRGDSSRMGASWAHSGSARSGQRSIARS